MDANQQAQTMPFSSGGLSLLNSSQMNLPARICQATYKDSTNFLALFNPDRQVEFTADLSRCYTGTAPVLGTVGRAFGESTAITWLTIQLENLAEFANKYEKMPPATLKSLAPSIKFEWGYMKVTELMHFFQLFKCGRYGRFYGSFDSMVVTAGLREYARDRLDYIAKFEAEAKRKAEAEENARHDKEVAEFKDMLERRGITIEQWIAENCDQQSQELINLARQ